jgi:LPS-assembly lipoprotein
MRRAFLAKPALSGLLLAAVTMLSGCGFHLRGESFQGSKLGHVFVQSVDPLVTDELNLFMEDAGATIVKTRAQADVVLTVSNEHFDKRVLTVDPNTGQQSEFEIDYHVDFSATRRDGKDLLPRATIELQRDYVFDPNAVLGMSREESVLQEEMRRDAVQQMLGRLDRALAAQ